MVSAIHQWMYVKISSIRNDNLAFQGMNHPSEIVNMAKATWLQFPSNHLDLYGKIVSDIVAECNRAGTARCS